MKFIGPSIVLLEMLFSAAIFAETWSSFPMTGGCKLQVEKTQGGVWEYAVPGYSSTKFLGPWPDENSRNKEILDLSSSQQIEAIERGLQFPKETLTIRFSQVNGRIQPVSYLYDPVEKRLKSKGRVSPRACSLQAN